MKKNILMRTNLMICAVIVVGFLLTAVLSYRANYTASLQNIEQVSTLTSEGIYYQIDTTLTKPLNISLTMANDSLLREALREEANGGDDPAYQERLRRYLASYKEKYGYDSVFLVSDATEMCIRDSRETAVPRRRGARRTAERHPAPCRP